MASSNDNLLDAEEIARLTAEFERASAAAGAGDALADTLIDDDPIADAVIADAPNSPAPATSQPEARAARTTGSPPAVSPVQFASLHPQPAVGDGTLDLLLDVQLQVSVELGRARMSIKDLLALAPGAVVELDKLAGEPVDVLVNGTLVAHGEVVVVDEKFGVRVTEVVSPSKRFAASG